VARVLASTPLRDDLREGGWWLLLGCAAGGVAGLVVGGVGGRLLMLVLRLTSPEFVGSVSDDGFEIGVVSSRTLQLFGATIQIGGLNGLGYAAARRFLAPARRLPVWTVVGGALGGAVLLHGDGIDFALRPHWLAAGGFVLVPALGAALTVVLVELLSRLRPWASTRWTLAGLAAALPAAVALLLALPVALMALALARVDALRAIVRPLGPGAAALLLAVVVALSVADLVRDLRAIF
jgi:hypothetical protein